MNSWEEYIEEKVNQVRMRGKRVIYPQHYQAWDELVDKQINSLNVLEIAVERMEALENGKSFEEVSMIHNTSGHISGFADMVIAYFSKKGPDYYEEACFEYQEQSDEMREVIKAIREENAKFQNELDSMQRKVKI